MNIFNDTQEHYNRIFENLHLEPGAHLNGEFIECKFIQCSFENSVLENSKFSDCSFQDCNLSLAQIPGSSFPGSRFEKSKLIGIDWTQGDWSALGFQKLVHLSDCVINHSTFIGLKLQGITIKNCLAHEVDFREADLTEANFEGTDLEKSLFGHTDLTKADLSQARNYMIDPSSNTLKKAKFSLPEAMALLHIMDIELVDQDE